MTNNPILVLNSGSSSLKAGLFIPDIKANFAGQRALVTAEASGIGQDGGSLSIRDADGKELSHDRHPLASQQEALTKVAAALERHGNARPSVVGHRMVHGGPRFFAPVRLTGSVLSALKQAVHFAPLHLPPSLKLVEHVGKLYPGIDQIACFDTAFHRTMPPSARRLPVSQRFAEAGVERYGFHGLSYESLVGQLRAEGGRLPDRIVFAHLGGGASLCAAYRGRSVDTTMGMTPAGGIPMATRTGDLDPGVLFFMARTAKLSTDALEAEVNHHAGLAAIAAGSGDMQHLERAMGDGDADAALAFDVFTTAVAQAIAGLTVSLRGLDLLVFAGGIGEHSAAVRAAVVERLAPFGVRLHAEANMSHAPSIEAANSKVPIRILAAREELMIAAHTRALEA